MVRSPGSEKTWKRPVIERIRELVEHPEVLRRAPRSLSAIGLVESSTRLTEEQRAQIEHEIAEIEQQRDVAARAGSQPKARRWPRRLRTTSG